MAVRRHLTYANVMSTAGVFLGLAGGYGIAQIGGDGSVRSGQVRNLTAQPKTVLRVPKMGKVTAHCENGNETFAAWVHTSKRKQVVSREFTDAGGGTATFVSNSGVVHESELSTAEPKMVFHIANYSGTDEPQTVVSVVRVGPTGSCDVNIIAEATSTR